MILTGVQRDLTYTFNVLPKSCIGFVAFLVFFALEDDVSFTRTCFYRTRSSVTIRNYVETFQTNIGHNLA